MRPETTEAFTRLVSTFVTAIEATGATLPDDIEQRLTENPLKACELLNELALSCDAIDDQTDAILAEAYASMDAADARGPVDELAQARIRRTFNRVHREPVVEEPEPAPAPVPRANEDEQIWSGHGTPSTEPAPSEQVSAEKAPADEQQARPKRRSRKTRAKQEHTEEKRAEAPSQDAAAADTPSVVPAKEGTSVTEASATQEPAPQIPAAEAPAPQAVAPQAPAEEAPAEAGQPAPQAGDKPAEPVSTAKEPAPAVPAPAEPAVTGDVLTVDQTIAALGLSRPTIYKFIENGKLPAYKKGRSWQISAAAVAELAKK